MNYSLLENNTFSELKKMAKSMGLVSKKSKSEYIEDIKKAFKEYEEYKEKKIDKYTKIKKLPYKGVDYVNYIVKDRTDKEFIMKIFRRTKSSVNLKEEYSFQKKVSLAGISPRVVEYDTVSKFIIMEKMDYLMDTLCENGSSIGLTKQHQIEIIDIFKKLDSMSIFYGKISPFNFMIKNNKIYIANFGDSKEIDSVLVKKLGTDTPNIKTCLVDLIGKLKESNLPSSSWKYLKRTEK